MGCRILPSISIKKISVSASWRVEVCVGGGGGRGGGGGGARAPKLVLHF